jgi:hypothetical protein
MTRILKNAIEIKTATGWSKTMIYESALSLRTTQPCRVIIFSFWQKCTKSAILCSKGNEVPG